MDLNLLPPVIFWQEVVFYNGKSGNLLSILVSTILGDFTDALEQGSQTQTGLRAALW